ncbi:hypothetical protein [Flavobacterium sp.]|uniref:hypothetical protein n=1 Tax=Flavobacterium sp. TaxID=239 RepID=UPI0024878342|nr:hypothetical protein [Flavobacterium sp.]MDI1316849.1 hypothetical protein [Flavobacterium sp.]
MPAAIIISSNEQNWIKEYLQETYDVVIKDAFDCQNLCALIDKQKGIKISYSTLRRLFDLVTNTNAPSRFILNQLSVAVGFKNWEVFKTHVHSFDVNVINQNLQLYCNNTEKYRIVLLETILNLPIHTWIGGYQFQNCINVAIEKNDFEVLDKVIIHHYDLDNKHIYEHITIGFQSLYFQSVSGNKQIIDFVKRHIATSLVLQKCLLQAYVNETYLDSFLGEWFSVIEDNTLPNLLLFKNLLLCQKAYNEKNISNAKTYYSNALKQAETADFEIHPILKARLGVWELILNKNPKKLTAYFNSLENPFDIADFAVIASRLLWIYDKEATTDFLEHIAIEKFPTVKNYFQKGRFNLLLLSLAIHYHLKKDVLKTKAYFKQIDITTFGYDIVNIEFYESWIEILKL